MVQIFLNCFKMVQNGARLSKIVKIVQNGPKSFFFSLQNDPKYSTIIEIGSNWSQIVQIVKNCSKQYIYPKCS